MAVMRFTLSTLLLAILVAVPVSAQDNSAAVSRFQLAEQYLRAGQSERAVAILEGLYAADPSNMPVFTRLKEAYENARKYDEGVALIDRMMRSHGESAVMLAERGAFHFLSGQERRAERDWRSAIALAPRQPVSHRVVFATQTRLRLFERASATIVAAREALGRPDAFQIEKGELDLMAGNWAGAAEEYLAYLRASPDQFGGIQNRLVRLGERQGAIAAFRAATDEAIRQTPANVGFRRLAAWLALEDGDFAAALDATRAVDRFEQRQGQALDEFATTARVSGAHNEAQRALALILDSYPGTPAAQSAELALARLHEEEATTRYQVARTRAQAMEPAREAVARFEAFARSAPEHAEAAAALLAAARLNRDILRDENAAAALLHRLLAAPGSSREQIARARIELGMLAMRTDDLDGATSHFSIAEETARTGDVAEEARLHLARMDFYAGEFDNALARVEAMQANTASDAANNALDLKLLLRDHRGPDPGSRALHAYAAAELLFRQGRAEEAVSALDALLAAHAGHDIEDEALYLHALALQASARPEEAAQTLLQIHEQHRTSHLSDRALSIRAQIIDREMENPSAAIEAYTLLLVEYPGSLFGPHARERVRALRSGNDAATADRPAF